MQRSTFVAACAAAASAAATLAAATPAAADPSGSVPADEPYDLGTATGTIFGSLRRPAGAATALPVALIVAGSGPTDRDGNSAALATNAYAKLATALAAHGIASVRFDKRGIAASRAAAPSEVELRFENYVADAAAWVAKLRADGRFGRVGIAGHSEGSLVGMVAARGVKVDAFVSLEGAGFPAAVDLRKQLAPQLAPYPDLAAHAERILASLEAGTTVAQDAVPPQLMSLFRPSVQPYLISWLRYDPRVAIKAVRGRVTIVQGTHDVQVTLDDGRALATARPDATYVPIEGMTHVLVDDPGTTLAEQRGAYVDGASRPLDATLVATVIAALRD